jgi:uncharacterized protein (TIGR03437 family)
MAQPVVQSVLNGASATTNLAPGTLVAINGTELAPADGATDSVSVMIGGVAAPVSSASPAQISALIPLDAATLNPGQQTTLPLIVTTPAGSSAAFNVTLSRVAPGIFTQDGTPAGPAIAWDANLNPLTAVGADPIVLSATGLGAATDPVIVFIGDQAVNATSAVSVPGQPGFYQITVTGQHPISNRVFLVVDSVQSNISTLPIPVGLNVANVTGSIDGLYPVAGMAPVTFSELLTAATFQIDFDIAPNAAPFTIRARSTSNLLPVSSAVINIDPTLNTGQAMLTEPTAATRVGDFSGAGGGLTDFMTGRPFPGNIVPLSRLDPLVLSAVNLLPMPTEGFAQSPNATFTASGALPPGGHFTIGSGTPQLSNFGGFAIIQRIPGFNQTITFQLFVDGLLVASKDLPYTTI